MDPEENLYRWLWFKRPSSGRKQCQWVPRISSAAITWDYSPLVASATMWEIETDSVGNAHHGSCADPGQPSYVGSPPTNQPSQVPRWPGPGTPAGWELADLFALGFTLGDELFDLADVGGEELERGQHTLCGETPDPVGAKNVIRVQ